MEAPVVGGRLIEIAPYRMQDGTMAARLWVVDTTYPHDETCVLAEYADEMPELRDSIRWQSGVIYFDNDRKTLKKVGYSYPAPCLEFE